MPPAALRRTAALLLVLLALPVAIAHGRGALVEVDNLVLRADGGFHPEALPNRGYAPIDFQGYVSFSSRNGGPPPKLEQAVIDFDGDGHLDVRGLPVCQPERIASATTEEARAICKSSIVGTGKIDVLIALSSGPIPTSAPLTIFNGPPQEGKPTVVLHARTTVPGTQTYAVVVPIEKHRGEFGYRATFDVPPIAAGYGAITRIQVKIGRRFQAGGKERSYVSARCTDNILRTRGRFTFSDGTVIDGAVEKYCRKI